MREYKDPLLEAFEKEMGETEASSKALADASSSEEEGDSDDESSSSEGEDIEFPRDDAEDLLQFIQRDLVGLNNTSDD